MLIVIADVERHPIERSVIRVRLVAFDEHVVLGDEVSRHGMKAERDEERQERIDEHSPADEVGKCRVEHELNERVRHLDARRRLWIDGDGPECVEQALQPDPAELAECRLEQARFQARRNVGVDYVVALGMRVFYHHNMIVYCWKIGEHENAIG